MRAMDLDYTKLTIYFSVLLFALAFHEAAHAWVADWRGDRTARDLGRVTLNPIVHLDFMMSLVVPLLCFVTAGFIFGGGKPVPVDPRNLRSGRNGHFDMLLIAAAGPISNVILATIGIVIFGGVLRLGLVSQGTIGEQILVAWWIVNVWLTLFNLLPIPPLDGSKILRYFLTGAAGETFDRLQYGGGMILLVIFIYLRGTEKILLPVYREAWQGFWKLVLWIGGA